MSQTSFLSETTAPFFHSKVISKRLFHVLSLHLTAVST
jgi:hypothetical protein